MIRLAKSLYLKGRQCSRRIWLAAHGATEPNLESEDVWEEREFEGAEVERQVATLYPLALRVAVAPDEEKEGERRGGLEQCIDVTRGFLTEGRPIMQAHLAAGDLLTIADLLEPRDDGWYVWEIKASTEFKPIFDRDLAFQCEVARRAGLRIVGAGVIFLDKRYRRGDELDVERMIRREDRTSAVAKLAASVRTEIEEQLAVLSADTLPDATPGSRCKGSTKGHEGNRPSTCGHLAQEGYCGSRLPENWAGRLPRLSGTKAHFVESMAVPSVENLDPNDPQNKWTSHQRRMIEAVHTQQPVIDAAALRVELDKLRWPVTYIDFEFDPGMAVPRYPESRPYERIPFQWSMLIQRRPGQPLEDVPPFLHVGPDDPRKSFLDALLAVLPPQGSIVAHHKSAEGTVLDSLVEFLGESYRAAVARIHGRFFDTKVLLQAGYYHPAQQGSYSIKKVAPALLGFGYGDLEIQDGMAAVVAWKRASAADCDPDTRESSRRDLLAYCGRDTRLMHDIIEEVRRLSGA